MSKKSGRVSRFHWYQIFSFIALILAAIIWLLSGLGVISHMGSVGPALILVRDICVLLAVAIGAYGMAKKLGKAWYIIYWIIIIVAILGIVFGSLSGWNIITIWK